MAIYTGWRAVTAVVILVMPPVGAGAPIVPIPMRCAVHVCGACSYVQ